MPVIDKIMSKWHHYSGRFKEGCGHHPTDWIRL